MSDSRSRILHWIEQGHIDPANIRRALVLGEVVPSAAAWRQFVDRLLLWMGTVLIASGLIFFLAYNWQALGRYAKFALAEGLVVVALLAVWHQGLERATGRAALFAAALCAGALLALIGQTYQTGADTFELFGVWALLILPWVVVARFVPLCLLWLGLVNVALMLYFDKAPSVFGLALNADAVTWVLFALNTVALVAWELAARHGIDWLAQRWALRLVATAGGVLITMLAFFHVVDAHRASVFSVPVWLVWLVAAGWFYRRTVKDLFVLAGGVLSVIVVVTSFAGRQIGSNNAAAFLLLGLLVIGLSGAGGWWLKRLAAEDGP